MKTVSLFTIVLLLPAASLLAKGPSEIEVLRTRVDVQERRISQLESAINRLTGSSALGSKKAIGTKAAPETHQTTSSKVGSGSIQKYVVAKGDILTRIAYRHHSTVAVIKKENNLKNDELRIGQILRIPMTSATAASHKTASKKSTKPSSKAPVAKSPEGKYTVKSGDTFYGIARRYQMNEASLQAANPKAVPTRLQIGQVLLVNRGSKITAKSATVKTEKKVTKKAPVKKSVAQAPKPKKPAPSVAKKASASTMSSPAPRKSTGVRTITVNEQMTYGAFATKHGASTSQLNSLNGLNLGKSTMLAKGSELYVPQF